jgi:hypothetical protein
LKSADIEIGLLSLLIGRLAVDLEVTGERSGALEIAVRMNLVKALMDNAFIPSVIQLNSSQFAIGPLVAYSLGKAAEGQGNSNPIVKELLENIVFVGDLDGMIDFEIDPSDPIQSSGQAELKLNGAKLSFANPSLNISPQNFELAALKAGVRDGNVVIDRSSRFKSEGLDFSLDGKIQLKEVLEKSVAEIELSLKLNQDLKQNYGFLLGSEGELNGSLRGVLDQIQFVKK